MPLVIAKPNYPPYVCIVCGVGERRKWFVDLQLAIDNYFNPVTAGAVYVCNECWDSIAVETSKQAQIFLLGTEPWVGEEYVEPTYDNESELVSAPTMKDRIESGHLFAGEPAALPVGSTSTDDTSTTSDDRRIEPDDQEPESSSTDEQAQPLREFGKFFGTKSGN